MGVPDDGMMPGVEISQPSVETPTEAPAETPATAPVDTPATAPVETRASRRASREATEGSAPSAPGNRARPVLAVATVLAAGLMLLAAHADPLILAAGYAWCVLVMAWAWPAFVGARPGWPVSLPMTIAGLLVAVGFALSDDLPYLASAPVALAAGTVLTCLLQLIRRDGRSGLTASLAAAGLGLGVVAMGATYLPVARGVEGVFVLNTAFAGVGVSVLADLLVGTARLRPWLTPLAMVLGGGAGALTAQVTHGPAVTVGLLLGLLSAGVAHAVRRVGAALPSIAGWQAQIGAGCASVLAPGVVVYVVGQVFVG